MESVCLWELALICSEQSFWRFFKLRMLQSLKGGITMGCCVGLCCVVVSDADCCLGASVRGHRVNMQGIQVSTYLWATSSPLGGERCWICCPKWSFLGLMVTSVRLGAQWGSTRAGSTPCLSRLPCPRVRELLLPTGQPWRWRSWGQEAPRSCRNVSFSDGRSLHPPPPLLWWIPWEEQAALWSAADTRM